LIGTAISDLMFERMFKEMTRDLPKDAMTERKLPDGSTVRQYGPYIYGYSMTMGPDGKPVVREFGNVKPSRRRGMFGLPEAKLEPSETREPLVDVVEDGESARVVAELPGVEKKDIQELIGRIDELLETRKEGGLVLIGPGQRIPKACEPPAQEAHDQDLERKGPEEHVREGGSVNHNE
jgi:HSP20 family molecular chaperone IbpA